MNWNYRLFKQDTPKSAEGEYVFFVGECYYENDKPTLHSTIDHNLLTSDTEEGARQVYEMVHEAYTTPVIELDEEGNFKT